MRNLVIVLFFIVVALPKCIAQEGDTAIFHLSKLPVEGVLLDKNWKFHAGDNMDWGKPGFNDNDWEDINPTLALHELPDVRNAEIGWLRLSLNVDSLLQEKTVALILTSLCAAEIYLDGKLIYRLGNVSSDYEKEIAYMFFIRPLILKLDNQGGQTLAIRFSFNKKNLYINFGAPPAFMKLTVREVNASFQEYLRFEGFFSSWRSIQMCVYLPLAILLFFFIFSV